ncbi:hypothetical protein JCM3770_006346, partial [Rhodotorula araucariae]
SGGAFQLLLGKPWKAQIGAVHFYQIDCILHETSVPGRWSRLWNENPKSAPEFTAVPHHPADLVEVLSRLPPEQEVNPAVLLLQAARGEHGPLTLLETACLTPIPEDDGLLSLDSPLPRALRASSAVLASTDPASMAAALRKEAWRRELTLHPRATISPASSGPAFLSEQEVMRVIHHLEKEDATSEFWRSVEPPVSDEWERWATPSLPEVDPTWLEPLPSEAAALPVLRVYMKAVPEANENDKTDTGLGEDPLEERRAEVRKVVQVGDENSNLSPSEREQVNSLLDEFTDQFAFSLEDVKATDTVRMRIPTPGAVPTRARHHPTNNPEQKAFLYEQIDKLIAAGVVVQVHYDEVSWVSHNKVAPKKDLSVQPKSRDELLRALEESIAKSEQDMHGWVEQKLDEFPAEAAKPKKWRLCHAFLDLNDATVGASWPTGDLNAKIGNLSGKKYYSCFDMHSGYFAIEIEPEDVLKTTFAVEDRGYYAYKRMPFGLKGAPAAFCELVSTAFRDELGKTMEAWMDDLATSSDSFDEHLESIRRILEICRKHKLSLNPAKCQLFASSLVWCGSHVSKDGVQPDKAKVQTVVEWPTPQNPHEVLRFINFAGHYRKLIKNFAQRTAPLQALAGSVKISQLPTTASGRPRRGAYREKLLERPADWEWTIEHQAAFDDIRRTLTSFPVLRAPDWNLPFIIETDASILGFGAVLAQRFRYEHPETGQIVDAVHPVEFASKATKPSEKRYSAFLLELVAVKWALEKFKPYVFGRPIELISDCQALAGILSLQSVSPAHSRWREYILGHDIVKFTHQPGKLNAAADELSRKKGNEEGEEVSPDATIPPSWEEYVEEKDVKAPLRKVPLSGLEPLEAAFSAFFVETHDKEAVLRKRFSGDATFEPIVEFLLTLQPPKEATTAEAGQLRRRARAYFIGPDGSLRRTHNADGNGRECIPQRERRSLILSAHEQLAHAGRDRV